jgi:hypothetical protein
MQYQLLTEIVRDQADRLFRLWIVNPSHPSLHFKRVKGTPDWWSVRIRLAYRALCIRDGDTCNLFFIGSHEDYDSLVP